ncbi:MAG: alpha/beta hydrolase family protein [Candidatus Levyibacteriota bacterium]
MKKILWIILVIIILTLVFSFLYLSKNQELLSPLAKLTPKPLLSYTFQNLKKDTFPKTDIILGRKISENSTSISQLFYYKTPKSPNSKTLETVSGLLNIPKKPGNYPVIIMFRGFVPDNIYAPGIGTQPSASQLVKSGYITLAPDFLGFGESASPSADSFENRFQTYTTALSLFSSLSTLNQGLNASYSGQLTADISKVGVWGHSNGGHIALSVLAISGKPYPTVLWAPVSKSFPYSILYYTDESDDQGKALRLALSQFENIYNVYDFSPERYYKWIKAPILINQGTADQEVPYWWSDSLTSILKKNKVDVTENILLGADHNMLPMSTWSLAITATIDFYNKEFGK